MSYKEPIYDYRAKDGLDPLDPKKKLMGYELMAEFEAIAKEITEVEGELEDHWVEKSGDVMTGTLDTPKLVAVDILAGEINADEVHAVTFHGNGEEITDIITDQLKDVNSENAVRDDLLIFNGTLWEATDFAFIETALTFKGGIDLTNSAEYPSLLSDGDLYIANADGVVAAEWLGIAGTTINAGNFVGWAESKGRWYLLGDLASASVTRVAAGLGIDVDDSVPAEPVVSIDRTEVDTWYADQTEFNELQLDVAGNSAQIDLNKNNIADIEANIGNINIGDLADKNHNHDGVYLKAETDPTVPAHVKSISTADIAKWNTPAAAAPVSSVNGKTGAVSLTYTDVGAQVAGSYQPAGSYAAASHNHSGVYQPAGSYAAASHTHSYVPLSGNSTVTGTLTATDFTITSDERLKGNVETLNGAKVYDMRGVSYTLLQTDEKSSGVIAQEMAEVAPELVVTDHHGYLSVAYPKLVGYLIEAVKGQMEDIIELRKAIEELS